jgi:hypothetical protein
MRRVRQAINYAVDHDGLCALLNGSAKPAMGLYPPDDPLFGTPQNRYRYDPEKARLQDRSRRAERGCGTGRVAGQNSHRSGSSPNSRRPATS